MKHDVLITGGADFQRIPGMHQALLAALGWTPFWVDGPIADDARLAGIITKHGPFPNGALAYVDSWGPLSIAALKRGGGTLISRSGTGFNTIDLDACQTHGVRVAITRGANAPFIAEAALAMLFDLELKVAHIASGLRAGQWKVTVPRESLIGKTIAVIGYGDIGSAMAARSAGLGMHVKIWSQNWSDSRQAAVTQFDRAARALGGGSVSYCAAWEDALSAADYVTLHMAANSQTDGWFGFDQVRACKPGALLVNTGRGQLLNDDAVLDGLRSGKLRGAALDHHRVQPVPAAYPYLLVPNVICTPHQAYNTPGCIEAQLTMALSHLQLHAEGKCDQVNAYAA